ncbi:MAG: hypothetical protein K2O44_01540 [Clostridia bacterium]|nr:hypothetical protein [Clostridia bacterium]
MDDLIKFIIAIAVLAAVVIALAYVSDSFTNWDIKTWFDFGSAVSEGIKLPSGNSALLRL